MPFRFFQERIIWARQLLWQVKKRSSMILPVFWRAICRKFQSNRGTVSKLNVCNSFTISNSQPGQLNHVNSNPRHGSQTSGQSIVIGPVSINGLQQVHPSTMLGCQPRLQLCLYRYQRLLSSPLLRPHPPDVVMRWFPRFWKSLQKKNNVFNSSRWLRKGNTGCKTNVFHIGTLFQYLP